MSPLQLPVILFTQDQPDSPRPTVAHLSFQVSKVFVRSIFSPALLHLEDLACIGKRQLSLQRGLQILLEKADAIAFGPANVMKINAMARGFSGIHWVHEPGHQEIVAI